MEVTFVIVFVVLAFYFWCGYTNEKELEDLRRDFRNFKNDTTYKLLLPKIEEYSKLSGFTSHGKDQDQLYFYGPTSMRNTYVRLYEIEEKLKELKEALERNCPTKCAAKAKKKK